MFSKIRLIVCMSFCVLLFSPVVSHGQKRSGNISYALFKGQPTPSKELLYHLGLQAHWGDSAGALNPSGLSLHFEKIVEPATPNAAAPEHYRVFAEGAAEDKVFVFGTWTLSKDFSADTRDIYVNGQGLLLLHESTADQELSFKADDEFEVAPMTGSAEPVRYLLAQRDGQMRIYATLVPHPVATVERGCRLEVWLAQPAAKSVLVVMDGFPAKDKIPLVLESAGESISKEMDTDENGHAVIAVFPYVPGKTQGILKASAEGPNCLPSVVLPWGPAPDAAAKPLSR